MATVPSGFGNSKVAQMETRAETRVHSLMPATIDELKRKGLWDKVQLLMMSDAYSNGKLHALNQAGTADADFTVSRGSAKNTVDNEGYIRKVPANYPGIDYGTGKPALRTDQQSQNKLLYWKSFENSYWTKFNCEVRLDPTTAGSELITNGDFTNWTNDNPDNWTIPTEDANNYVTEVSGAARLVSDSSTAMSLRQDIITLNESYKVEFTISNYVSGGIYIRIGGINYSSNIFAANGTYVVYLQSGDGNDFQIVRSYGQATDLVIDNISVKEVQSYASPFKDTSGNVVLQSRRIYDTVDSSAQYHAIESHLLSITGGSDISFKFIIKQGNIKNITLSVSLVGNTIRYPIVRYNTISNVFSSASSEIISYSSNKLADGNIEIDVIVSTLSTDTGAYLYLYLANNTNNTLYQGDGTGYVELAYAQFNEGEATGIICPYDTAENQVVTRLGDVIDNAVYTGSSDEFVLFAEIQGITKTNSSTHDRRMGIVSNDVNNSVFIGYEAGGSARAYIRTNGTTEVSLYYNIDCSVNHKLAIRAKKDDVTFWIDGTKVNTDTAANMPIGLSKVRMYWAGTYDSFIGNIKQVGVFDYLTDSEMETLTK